MWALLSNVIPVFALIACGYAAGRSRILDGAAASALNAFVYFFALPALLFLFTAQAPISEILNVPFLFSFLLGSIGAYLLTFVAAVRLLSLSRTESALAALAGTFPNTAYLGIPLFLALGDDQSVGAAIAATVAANTIFIGGSLAYFAFSDQKSGPALRSALEAAFTLAKNPLIVAPLLALPFAVYSVSLPAIPVRFLELLGGTAGPAALFALGLSFLGRPFKVSWNELFICSSIKLALQPLLVAVLAYFVFPVPGDLAKSAVILAAFPTGALAFVLALQRGSFVSQASAIMIITTLLSMISVPVLLLYL